MILKDQIALVTGASRGIGQAIALELGHQGAFVIGTATSANGLRSIDTSFNDHGIACKALVLDVADAQSVASVMQTLAGEDHMPTILVNNAGIRRDNLVVRMSEEEWSTVINTNLTSIYRLCKACLRGMMKARAGRIINISSVVGLAGNAGQVNYAAAKAGIIGLTRALAREVASRGITVNAVAPGFIETDMTSALSDAQRNAIIQQIPLSRLGHASEVASAVAFLASPAAAYITGEVLNINGGMYMG
ncbi:MAG: 3-oxoacyl-ACP reductase FabG [Gammaproteobacteria bacterium]|nr:3-oxoacyl-ACP reductase FabG [Gammaproteobacteria bacterium]MCI0590321.1 3-oxoacyl-ACP reductase FabG [Gammaproteobacteria bacterium]